MSTPTTLQTVIDTEKGLRQQMELERRRVEAWLETATRELRKRFEAESQELEHRRRALENEDLQAAQDHRREILSRWEKEQQRLESLSDQALCELLRRHLRSLLPRGTP